MILGAAIVTADQLAPLNAAITDNIPVLLPVGLSIMAVLLGVKLIPKVIGAFFH